MDIFTTIFNLPIAQFLGIGLVVVILQRAGIDVMGIVKTLLNKNGEKKENGNHRIEDLEDHAKVANEEMRNVKERLVSIETKIDIIMRHLQI